MGRLGTLMNVLHLSFPTFAHCITSPTHGELLERLQLGVKTSEKIVKEMTINPEFFEEL